MKYEIDFYDPDNGATSPIDVVTAHDGYTPDEYVSDCEANADQEWIDMLHRGTVKIYVVE